MGGSGILPTCIHKNKLYFLFGKENQYEDSAPGFSDFGGGTDGKESYLQTAIREGGEELTGFLGSDDDLKRKLEKHGVYHLDLVSPHHTIYRMHIFPMEYDEKLPYYYNNNQRFLQKRLEPKVIQESKIFEKAEIRWISIDDLPKMRSQFRHYFHKMVDQIYDQRKAIELFIRKGLSITKKTKTLRKKTVKNKTRNFLRR
jgi:8-oxo-dGTP pyrophosphatase MutT (NUDIX family)